MAKNLVIVESPAKAKTISRFLGKDFKVLASMGHVVDLPKSKMGIEIDNDFKPTYMVSPEKKKVIDELKGELKKASNLWIATDEDREGEAIGWHLLSVLKPDKKKVDVGRIVFHEITERAIKDSLKSARKIDENIVDAQQARRVLDRLVGYELSPLLWKKVRYGLSAGRVQSVAVRFVVEREREIKAFKPDEYWTVTGNFLKKGVEKKDGAFSGDLQKYKGEKFEIKDQKKAKEVLKDLQHAKYKVTNIEEKQTKKYPAPPFITSTLQQEASRKLGFSVKKTMIVAQQLYEGVNMGEGETGVITYMRTDSVNLSGLALKDAKDFIEKEYGKEYALSSPRMYKGRKDAQAAHEAIRPVNLFLTPDKAGKFLDKDQLRLYELVWKRMIACQMAEAVMNNVAVDIEPEKSGKKIGYMFRANGQTVEFPGFMKVYTEGKDAEEGDDDREKILPKLEVGEEVSLDSLNIGQHFTKPPARYTEASLVKKLESEGIGRPSTYAPTIHTIITRGYVEKEQKALKPTDLGDVVTDVLVKNFSEIVDYKFTAEMENELDEIEEGKRKWVPVIREFYGPFHKNLKEKDKTLKKADIVNEKTDEKCEKCGSKMVIKLGRFGKFLSCSNYPECKNARPLAGREKPKEEQAKENKELAELKKKFKDKKCDKCGKNMEVKIGRYGAFLGCSDYPNCKNIMPIIVFSGVKCPKCKVGQLVERHTRKGARIFWGCNKFPRCHMATWHKPVKIDTKTGKLMVENKEGKTVFLEEISREKGGRKKKKEE